MIVLWLLPFHSHSGTCIALLAYTRNRCSSIIYTLLLLSFTTCSPKCSRFPIHESTSSHPPIKSHMTLVLSSPDTQSTTSCKGQQTFLLLLELSSVGPYILLDGVCALTIHIQIHLNELVTHINTVGHQGIGLSQVL